MVLFELFGFELRAKMWDQILNNFPKDLPSYRSTRQSIAGLERVIQKCEKEIPAEAILRMPEKKLRKLRGQCKYRVSQQDKIMTKKICKLVEELVIREINSSEVGVKLRSGKVLRTHLQKRIAETNRLLNERAQKTLSGRSSAASKALYGE
jgi:hypothetical protein